MALPPYANPNPIYQQAMRLISNITNANPAVVTTTFDHQYQTGMQVRLNMTSDSGMEQINKRTGEIVVTGDTTFTIDIDSTFFDPFIVPVVITPPPAQQWPQVIPTGENNAMLSAATRNVLPF